MKIAFLIDCSEDQIESVKKSMSEFGYSCIPTNNPEEIEQTGKQIGKVVLCFTDSKASYRFLKSCNTLEFRMLNLLFLKGRPKITEDAARKIREVDLNLIVRYDNKAMGDLIKKFENQKQDTTEEIEFLVSSETKRGRDDEAA
jgi:hypothetical protein